jgi:hypothetical protein
VFSYYTIHLFVHLSSISYYRMCSLTIECVLILHHSSICSSFIYSFIPPFIYLGLVWVRALFCVSDFIIPLCIHHSSIYSSHHSSIWDWSESEHSWGVRLQGPERSVLSVGCRVPVAVWDVIDFARHVEVQGVFGSLVWFLVGLEYSTWVMYQSLYGMS